jgi:hypothetical protein
VDLRSPASPSPTHNGQLRSVIGPFFGGSAIAAISYGDPNCRTQSFWVVANDLRSSPYSDLPADDTRPQQRDSFATLERGDKVRTAVSRGEIESLIQLPSANIDWEATARRRIPRVRRHRVQAPKPTVKGTAPED